MIRQIAVALAPDLRSTGVRVGLAVLILVVGMAALAPLSGYNVVADADSARASLGPSPAHLLGTDHLGRDTWWRLVFATRAFVGPGTLSAAVAAAFGIPLGALAGWVGGATADAARWGWGVISAVPSLVLVLLCASIFDASPIVLACAIGVSAAPGLAEALAAQIALHRRAEYVLGMSAHGVSDARILWLHLVIGAGGRSIVRTSLATFAQFVALESTLAYLGGFGVREPVPSWGNMLVFEWGRAGLIQAAAPVVALWASLLAVHALADAFAEPADG